MNALGMFLKMVDVGHVPIENLDRLSREAMPDALILFEISKLYTEHNYCHPYEAADFNMYSLPREI